MKNNIVNIDASKSYSLYVDKVLERSKQEIISWFNISNLDFKVTTYIYKDKDSLRLGLRRHYLKEYPSYLEACMIDQDESLGINRSINIYEPNDKGNNKSYSKKEYNQVIFHELVHYITDILFGKLPEWLTEGIAKLLDGSYQEDLTSLMKNHINNYVVPEVSNMKGDFFCIINPNYQEEQSTAQYIYNGYDFSYIMVRYIIEFYGKDYLFELMKNKESIIQVQQSILIEAINYFNAKYCKESTIKF